MKIREDPQPTAAPEYMSFEEYKAELIAVYRREVKLSEYDPDPGINDKAAREYFDSGFPPYYCFREEV